MKTLAQIPAFRQRAAEMGHDLKAAQQKAADRGRRASKNTPQSEKVGGRTQQRSKQRRSSQSQEPSAPEEKKKGGRRRRESVSPGAELQNQEAEVSGTTQKQKQKEGSKIRRRRGSQEGTPERSEDVGAKQDEAENPRSPATKPTRVEWPETGQASTKGVKAQRPGQETQDNENNPSAVRKKISRGILSRAGSLFRRSATGAATKKSEE